MRKIAAAIVLCLSPGYGQQARPPAPPELLFRMTLENTARALVSTEVLTNPNLILHAYGDGRNIPSARLKPILIYSMDYATGPAG
jgi:hypothetical protein